MSPKTKPTKWCDPYITGLLPLFGFIIGIIMCNVSSTVNNYDIDQSEWHCARFEDGECTRYDRNPKRTTKND